MFTSSFAQLTFRLVARTSALNKFLESQQNSLDKLRDGIKRLEELKARAMTEPGSVFQSVMDDVSLMSISSYVLS
jgi:hypothetical protein